MTRLTGAGRRPSADAVTRHGRMSTPTIGSTAHPGVLCDDRPVNPIDVLDAPADRRRADPRLAVGRDPADLGLIGAIGGGVIAILLLPTFADPLAVDRSDLPADSWSSPAWSSRSASASRSAAPSVAASPGALGHRPAGDGRPDGRRRVRRRSRSSSIVWLAGGLLAEGPVPRLAETAGGSTAVRTLALFLPPPTEIAAGLGGWLDTTGLPDVFVGFEPLPAPPVDRPDDPAARPSRPPPRPARSRSPRRRAGCRRSGRASSVSPSYVLTNAHVVAGSDAVRVLRAGGQVLDAVPVLFDPALDVALLHVDGPAGHRAAASPRRTRAAAPSVRPSAIPAADG